MKIAILTDFFYPRFGGIATHIEGLAHNLLKEGWNPIVVTTAGKKPCLDFLNLIPIIRIPAPVTSTLMFNINGLKTRVLKTIQVINPDIIHAHHAFSPMGIIASLISKQLGIPSILTNHSIPPGYWENRYGWYLLAKLLRTYTILKSIKMYDEVIAVSPLAADFISKFYPGKIHIIPNAIDLDEFRIKARKSELGIDNDSPIILMVGRSSPRKGYELALLTLKILMKKLGDIKLIIAGPTGIHRSYLRTLAKLLRVEKNLWLPGYLPRKKLLILYKVADIFLHVPYGGESFGIVLLEAMAAGIPIIATKGNGLRYVLEKSGAGICIPNPSPAKLSNTIMYLLENEELRRKMSQSGQNYVKKFSWRNVIKCIIGLYEKLLSRK